MAKKTLPLSQAVRRDLAALGARIKAARLRREMTQPMLAERIGVTVRTLAKLENGDASINLATLLRALAVLGFEADIRTIATHDPVGRELQDARLKQPKHRSGAST